ncbi:MAG: signal recognition particle-docking protein FtsY [SAR202 cluster bacterium]|nr:signal recognition particle-docking protein FtsY [SAR202 cluster bacterium]
MSADSRSFPPLLLTPIRRPGVPLFGFLKRKDKEDKARTELAVEKTKKGVFGKMATLFSGEKLDDSIWDQMEEILITSDVGVNATQYLVDTLKERVKYEKVDDPGEAFEILKDEMVYMLEVGNPSRALEVRETPLIILMVGVNGVGKTTSIAKLTNLYKESGKKVLLGAADTYRAAAIDQLQAWGKRLGVDVIAHTPGADPGAVAFDAMQAAKSRGVDVLIIDTAGRLHTKVNLMEEIKKIQRVLARQGDEESIRVVLALDATTGQNGLLQVKAFTDAVRCEGVFLSKLDGTAKGGIVLAVANDLKVPVLYIGTGEQPDDIAAFDPREFVEAMFGPRRHASSA